jgi:hypothetical protein
MGNGAVIAHLWPLDAQFFGLTVDALASSALGVESMGQGAIAIEGHPLDSPQLPIGIFLTALTRMEAQEITGLTSGTGKEQGTTKALRAIAVGVVE